MEPLPGPWRTVATGTHQPGAVATGTHQPGAAAITAAEDDEDEQ